ncbi:MAG: hypothetical protein JSV54_06415 [Chloroflexota bacterium]|nr:MAG: hypothetical protein JSV54_06415 [Chloroflexota bacterium]
METEDRIGNIILSIWFHVVVLALILGILLYPVWSNLGCTPWEKLEIEATVEEIHTGTPYSQPCVSVVEFDNGEDIQLYCPDAEKLSEGNTYHLMLKRPHSGTFWSLESLEALEKKGG